MTVTKPKTTWSALGALIVGVIMFGGVAQLHVNRLAELQQQTMATLAEIQAQQNDMTCERQDGAPAASTRGTDADNSALPHVAEDVPGS